jgi:hypothetical protein
MESQKKGFCNPAENKGQGFPRPLFQLPTIRSMRMSFPAGPTALCVFVVLMIVRDVKLPAHRAGLPGKERTKHDCAP